MESRRGGRTSEMFAKNISFRLRSTSLCVPFVRAIGRSHGINAKRKMGDAMMVFSGRICRPGRQLIRKEEYARR